MNINWAAPTIDIIYLDYPPIFYILDYPPNHFSPDSSHALSPIILGCSSAYGMHVCQFQYSLLTCKYITRIYSHKNLTTQACYVIIISNTKISSLGLMIKHEQFNLNHSAKHIFSQKYNFENTISGIVKPSFTIPEKSQNISSLSEPGFHGHFRPYTYQNTI